MMLSSSVSSPSVPVSSSSVSYSSSESDGSCLVLSYDVYNHRTALTGNSSRRYFWCSLARESKLGVCDRNTRPGAWFSILLSSYCPKRTAFTSRIHISLRDGGPMRRISRYRSVGMIGNCTARTWPPAGKCFCKNSTYGLLYREISRMGTKEPAQVGETTGLRTCQA